MSDSKLLKIYLDIVSGVIRYKSGGLIAVEYPSGTDIYDSYSDLIIRVKHALKELKNGNMEG